MSKQAGIGVMLLLLALLAGPAAGQTVRHGNDAERQVVREMQARLADALAKNDLSACAREGENLARYQRTESGLGMIDADRAAVERRLRDIRETYDYFRQIHELNAQRAVEAAYRLIREVGAKLLQDVVSDVSVTAISAPLPGVAPILVQMTQQSADFLGNFNDARQVVNRARALRDLDRLAGEARRQMESLQPAIREAQRQRQQLNDCRSRFVEGAGSPQAGSSTATRSATHTAQKGGAADSWSTVRVTLSNVYDFQTQDQRGWRNNGTGFTATTDGKGRVRMQIDIEARGGISYHDYEVGLRVQETGGGRVLVDERRQISREGGRQSVTAEWDAAAARGGLSVRASIAGGNPEGFIYYVEGTVQRAAGAPPPRTDGRPAGDAPATTPPPRQTSPSSPSPASAAPASATPPAGGVATGGVAGGGVAGGVAAGGAAAKAPPAQPQWLQELRAEWQRCAGKNLFSKELCRQRARDRFCPGHWNTVKECERNEMPAQ